MNAISPPNPLNSAVGDAEDYSWWLDYAGRAAYDARGVAHLN